MAKHAKATDEFARHRSNEASKISFDLCKPIAQVSLLINGGAATAVIALLAKDRVDQALLTFVPLALVGYAIGVLVSAYMLYCVMMLADDWNYYWYHLGYTLDEKEAGLHEESAYRWDKRMHLAFAAAALCFALASSFIALGMWKTTPPPQPIPAITTPATK